MEPFRDRKQAPVDARKHTLGTNTTQFGWDGWGLFVQGRQGSQQTERIEVRYDTLRGRDLVFELPDGADSASPTVMHRLSLWQAAEWAGLVRVEMEGELLRRGISLYEVTADQLDAELAAMDRLGVPG